MDIRFNSFHLRRVGRFIPMLALIGASFLAIELAVAASAVPAPTVSITASGLSIQPPAVENIDVMRVQIVDPNDAVMLESESSGETVDWFLSGGEVDGLYRYEAHLSLAGPADEQGERPGLGGTLARSGSTRA